MVQVLRGARILEASGQIVEGRAVVIGAGRIAAVIDGDDLPQGAAICDLDGGILVPGFIDTQVNGGGGLLFNDEPTVDAIRAIGAAHRQFGTTGFLPTLISDEISVIDRAMRAVETAVAQGLPGVLGIHLEGPLLSDRRSGAHDPARFRSPDADLLSLMTSLKAGVTLVTLAPEVAGTEAIRHLVANGVHVAAGHTQATYDEARAGLAAGVRGFTHLFNAMSGMTSRAPGCVGAALEDPQAWCGLIVDGVHVHPAVLCLALKSRPIDRFMLVTDAMPPVGTNDRRFSLQGRTIEIVGDRCLDAHGTLAGSVLDMAAAVRNCVRLLGLDLATAVALASASPAAFLGIGHVRGQIASGMIADLVWLDDEMDVRGAWIAGQPSGGTAA